MRTGTDRGSGGGGGGGIGGRPAGQGSVQVVDVPVLDVREAEWVEGGTGAVVAVGCLWVVWCLFAVARGPGGGRGRRKVE